MRRQDKLEEILKSREKDQQLDTEMRAIYDCVELKGAVLIDGHHIFINVVREVSEFRSNPEEWLRSIYIPPEAMQSVGSSEFFNFNAITFAAFYGQLVARINDHAFQDVFSRVFEDDRSLLTSRPKNSIDEFVAEFPPEKYVIADQRKLKHIFDATMPPLETVKEQLTKNYSYWKNRNEKHADTIGDYVKRLENQEWEFFDGDARGPIVTPYALKNDMLAVAQKDWVWGGFDLVLQERWINAYSGRVISIEKGVDTNLVIKGCEYANDNDCDWVWLVTNDGDHSPLIRHLRSKNKEVYLSSLTDRPSRALTSSLAQPENYVGINDIEFPGWRDEAPYEIDCQWTIRWGIFREMIQEVEKYEAQINLTEEWEKDKARLREQEERNKNN